LADQVGSAEIVAAEAGSPVSTEATSPATLFVYFVFSWFLLLFSGGVCVASPHGDGSPGDGGRRGSGEQGRPGAGLSLREKRDDGSVLGLDQKKAAPEGAASH
jgi:hypothetical protein